MEDLLRVDAEGLTGARHARSPAPRARNRYVASIRSGAQTGKPRLLGDSSEGARFSAIRGSVERMQLQSMASLIIAGLFSRPAYSIPSYRLKARREALGVLDP